MFTATNVALHADSGNLAGYFDHSGDHWDYDAVQQLILADLKIGGTDRHVIMQGEQERLFLRLGPPNRATALGERYAYVNWASGIDMQTGRPILTPQADWYSEPKNVYPSWAGPRYSRPWSFNPRWACRYPGDRYACRLGEHVGERRHSGIPERLLHHQRHFSHDTYDATALKRDFGPLPDLKTLQGPQVKLVREPLLAGDPIAQKTVLEEETSSGVRDYDGGVLSTASNLVFQGRGSGELWVYAADTGKVLKRSRPAVTSWRRR